MRPALTLATFTAALGAVFAAAAGVGSAVGSPPRVEQRHDVEHAAEVSAADATPGLAVSEAGYTLDLATTTVAPAQTAPFRFTILAPNGRPLTGYTRTHDKDLHLVVVRRDGTRFQHLHPVRDAAGQWSLPLRLGEPGPYKVFADFLPAGRTQGLTLAADVTAPGSYTPAPQAAEVRTATSDGYSVTLDGTLTAGRSSRVVATVRRGGRPVRDLQPYLGAYGHLVALRDGDLAYLHVHPDETAEPGPSISFAVDVPTAGQYRLFLDFQHEGRVRTVSFSARTGGTAQHGEAPHGH